MLYVDLNLTSRVSSGHSSFLPHQNWLLVYVGHYVLPSLNKGFIIIIIMIINVIIIIIIIINFIPA